MKPDYILSFTECEKSSRGCVGHVLSITIINPITGDFHEVFNTCTGICWDMLNPFFLQLTGLTVFEFEETYL